jgi:dihydrofolate reductase
MSRVRVNSFTVSLDGYGAGPNQSVEDPLGVGGEQVHDWLVGTRTFRKLFGSEGGSTGVDDEFAQRGFAKVGAWILGRNMFGPVRGPWPDENWRGWWGDEPPYRCDVFVLTHYPRESFAQGETTFHFVTGGIEGALARAQKAAGDKDVRVGGGVATIQQYWRARLIDELHLAFAPVFLGSGEALFAGIDVAALGYAVTEHVPTPAATHVVLTKRATR